MEDETERGEMSVTLKRWLALKRELLIDAAETAEREERRCRADGHHEFADDLAEFARRCREAAKHFEIEGGADAG